MMNQPRIERLVELTGEHIQGLCDILVDCVEGGASVGFMVPMTQDRAVEFWTRVAKGVATGKRALLIASDELGICGTVQLVLDLPENQPHRADLVKMLVHRRARRRGLGSNLMLAAESMPLGSMNVSAGSEWVTFPTMRSCPMAHRAAQLITTAVLLNRILAQMWVQEHVE